MKQENPSGPVGKSSAEGHPHQFSGSIHQKAKSIRDSYAKSNQKSAGGKRIEDSVQPTPDPGRFSAYGKSIPVEKSSNENNS